LEEAFDHVDVVVKRADQATVTVDGGMMLSLKVRAEKGVGVDLWICGWCRDFVSTASSSCFWQALAGVKPVLPPRPTAVGELDRSR